MGKVAKFDASSGETYLVKSFPAAATRVFACEFLIPAATLTAIDAIGPGQQFTADFGQTRLVDATNGPLTAEGLLGTDPVHGTWEYETDDGGGASAGALVAGAWQSLEFSITFSDAQHQVSVVTINGAVVATDTRDWTPYGAFFVAEDPRDADMQFTPGASGANGEAGEIYYIRNVVVTDGATTVFSDDFSSGDFSLWDSVHSPGGASVVDDPIVAPSVAVGGVRVAVAFDDPMLSESPTWTYLTDANNLVAGYDIDRGRQSEAEVTEPASASVRIYDQDGVLDPTNSSGPYYGLIEPTMQIKLELNNPMTDTIYTRFRGFIDEMDYTVEPFTHQNEDGDTVGVTTLVLSCVGLATVLSKIEMQPGEFGDTPPPSSAGTEFFDNATFQDRITQVLGNAGLTSGWFVVFTGNVNLYEGVYSPGQNPMDVIQDACDAEFPEVSNAYEDRLGRLACHGRLAKFDPAGTASDAGPDVWDFTHWKCGDGAAVTASPSDTAHVRAFAFNRGWKYVVNSALASPKGISDDDIPGQLVKDTVSIGLRGICSWSKSELLTESGILTGNDANDETKLFASYKIANYAEPRNRITDLKFRSISPEATGAAANWDLLCRADISDVIDVTVSTAGGGGFNAEPFFIEGIRETAEPLNPEYANVTLNLDVSPQAYFNDAAGLDGA